MTRDLILPLHDDGEYYLYCSMEIIITARTAGVGPNNAQGGKYFSATMIVHYSMYEGGQLSSSSNIT